MKCVLIAVLFLSCCGSDRLVSLNLPDSGTYEINPPNYGTLIETAQDSGIIVKIPDSGTSIGTAISCIANPSCIVPDGGLCNSGYQSCQSDGTLGPCVPYATCPTTSNGCGNSVVDLVFILDDSNNMGEQEFSITQQGLGLFSLENPQPNYRWGLIDSPWCAGWPAIPSILMDEQEFLTQVSIQCIANTNVTNVLNLATQQLDGGIIAWDINATQKYIIVFTSGNEISNTIENNTTSIQFGTTGTTLGFIFNYLSQNITCLSNPEE